jgi:hypothetical protein
MNQKIKFPRSEKVYLPGTLFPELRVAMRKVEQVPSTNFIDGEKVLTPLGNQSSCQPAAFGNQGRGNEILLRGSCIYL